MVISNSRIFGCMRDFIQSSFNLLHPFPNGSLLQSFFQSDSDSGELEEDNSGEYPFCEQPFSICSVCGYKTYFHWAERFTIDSAFERFTMHLDSTSHQQKLSALLPISRRLQYLSASINEPLEKNLEAVTSVFWDPRTCPVPPGCDPRRFGLCIKRFLGNQGYSGPLTITAIGVLTDDVPPFILEGVYSSGVSLNNAFGDRAFSETLDGLITGFTLKNEPPANIMVISDGKYFTSKYAFGLELSGYNILRCDSLESIFSLPDSGALEDDECIDEMSESAFWICSICDMGKRYQGFQNFSSHVLSRQHSLQWEKWHLCSGQWAKANDVPPFILEGVYSSGVSLNNAFGDRAFSETLDGLITGFTLKNEPPANIMVISDGKYFTSKYAFGLELSGYNILRCDSLESIFSLPDSGALEDDECIDEMSESAFWICSICDMGKRYQGFQNFSSHVLSRQHSLQWEKWHLCSGQWAKASIRRLASFEFTLIHISFAINVT
ncbi:PREDICTED: uncharacterized protein LOC104733180 [Camelina sativa]|uniref:Uncharacterized protein LOC104733180 n=1 Tax=Camelina sativa TaxID=90675 RepID=A0ABM1QQI1_CAMSA|nr:PREDICTED: uncharacterized protein LOC104733180 [Camelina sativa]